MAAPEARPVPLTRGPPADHGRGPEDATATGSEAAQLLTEDHNRIAQRLNDVVVHRMFAAGLDLQAALALIGDHRGASEISHAVEELDQAIKYIQDTIFDDGRREPRSFPR
jgi:signal transduction histidine kinase